MVHTLDWQQYCKFYYRSYACGISSYESYLDEKQNIHLIINEYGPSNTVECEIGDELIIDMMGFISKAEQEKYANSNIFAMFEKYRITDIDYKYEKEIHELGYPLNRYNELFTIYLEQIDTGKTVILFNKILSDEQYISYWYYLPIDKHDTKSTIETQKEKGIKKDNTPGFAYFIGTPELFSTHWANTMCETSFDRTLNKLGKIDPFTREKMKNEMTDRDWNMNYLFIFFWGFIPQTKEGYGYLLMTILACGFWTIWYSRWILILLTLALYWVFNVKSKSSKR